MNNKPYIVSKNDADSISKSNLYNIDILWKQINKLKTTVSRLVKSYDIETKLSDLLNNNKKKVYITTTESYTVDYYIDVVLVDATSGAITIYLQSVSYNDGRVLIIKKTDISANNVTIDAFNSETIDGSATYTLSDNTPVQLLATNNGWIVIN